MKLFIVQQMPDPRDPGCDEALAKWIGHFVEETDGRAFVLFTSYRGMQQIAGRMDDIRGVEVEPVEDGWKLKIALSGERLQAHLARGRAMSVIAVMYGTFVAS